MNSFNNENHNLDNELEKIIRKAAHGKGLAYFKLPESYYFKDIPQDSKNPLNFAKVKLGKLLYHETALGLEAKRQKGIKTYSCASCHHVAAGFAAGTEQGIGEGGLGFGDHGELRKRDPDYTVEEIDVQPIKSPTTLNTAWQEVMLWNGQLGATGINKGTEDQWIKGTPKEVNFLGYEGLESQAIVGLKIHRMGEISNTFISQNPTYRQLFQSAFPDVPEEELFTTELAGLAIAAYERNLIPNEAPFQKWLRGELNVMNDAEKRGAKIFFGKASCVRCHTGPALNSMTFYALGFDNLEGPEIFKQHGPNEGVNLGRGGFTGEMEDLYKYKTPQLYNLADSPFYGHGSTFKTIREVVEYKNKAIPVNENVPQDQLADEFKPLDLSEKEIEDLVQFLKSGLRDQNLQRYVPDNLPSGNCFPNNDLLSKKDLGCE